jgi:hypothetical protein
MRAKLNRLIELEGLEDLMEFLQVYNTEPVVPGICTNAGCDHTEEVEPDCTDGWCEVCNANTIKSGLILAGVI